MWTFLLKWGLKGLNFAKDSRTIQVALMIGVMFFIDWRMDSKDQKLDELKSQMADVQAELALTKKEIENRETTTRIIERHYYSEGQTTKDAAEIVDYIKSVPEDQNGTIPDIDRDTNARINCLLWPSVCGEDEGTDADNP
jgi:hypothetical protein